MEIYNNAKTAKEGKETLIANAAKQREQDEYNAIKAEGDKAFYDLEGLRNDEQAQVDAFKEEAKYWENERYVALEKDDLDTFNEFQKFYDEALANVEKAKNKFEATDALYQIEKTAKESRDRDEIAK